MAAEKLTKQLESQLSDTNLNLNESKRTIADMNNHKSKTQVFKDYSAHAHV